MNPRAALVGGLLALALASACGVEQRAAPAVGLVFDIGGRGDKSFNDAAWRGLERAKGELGVSAEAVAPTDGSDRESALRMLAERGTPLLFGVGFMFTDDVDRLAREFPKASFACIDYALRPGATPPTNVLALKFKEEEGSYLVGALAALVSKSGTIGFVGGMESPLIRKFQAGFEAGAKKARPGIAVKIGTCGSTGEAFKNPARAKEIALAQIDGGADVIYHAAGQSGAGVFEAVRQREKPGGVAGVSPALAIGVDSDQYAEAPGRVLTSMVKHVEVAVFDTIQSQRQGRFAGGVRELGLRDGGVDYVYDERNKPLISDEIHAQVEALRAAIVKGEIVVPKD